MIKKKESFILFFLVAFMVEFLFSCFLIAFLVEFLFSYYLDFLFYKFPPQSSSRNPLLLTIRKALHFAQARQTLSSPIFLWPTMCPKERVNNSTNLWSKLNQNFFFPRKYSLLEFLVRGKREKKV